MAQKVSQATIDKIKAMGMTKALKGASGASPEMKEALTRMYGARRVSAASGSSKPAAKSADAARAAASKPAKPVAKTADAARLGAQNMPYKSGTKTTTSNMPYKAGTISTVQNMTTKKTSTTSNPFTAAHNKLSPYGNKNQKFSFGSSGGKTVASIKAENAKRMGITVAEYNKRMAAAKKR